MELQMKQAASLITNVWAYAVLCSISPFFRQIQAMPITLYKQQIPLIPTFNRPTFAFCARPNVGGAATASIQLAINARQTTIFTSGIQLV